jgi:hypothetical protein
MEAEDQDISAGKSGPIEESEESRTDTRTGDQDISAGKSGPTVDVDEDDSESSGDS